MGEFVRDRLPEPQGYFESEGLTLAGRGKWRTTRCEFHGGSDSMRVNTETGGFICMAACGSRGRDVLSYHRAAHGLGFVEAARALGAYTDDGKSYTASTKPTPIPARELLECVSSDLMTCALILSDTLANGWVNDDHFDRYRECAARILFVAGVANG